MAYDKKFKEQVIKHLEAGHTQQATAELFGIGTTTIKEWKKQLKRTGNLETNKSRNRKPSKIFPDELMAYISANPDAYLSEIAQVFNCSAEGIRKALKKLKITRKKRH